MTRRIYASSYALGYETTYQHMMSQNRPTSQLRHCSSQCYRISTGGHRFGADIPILHYRYIYVGSPLSSLSLPILTSMKVLLKGATGVGQSFWSLTVKYSQRARTAAGLGILRILLSDNSVSHVTYLGRRPLPPWIVLPGSTSTTDKSPTHPKLFTIGHKDFLTYPPALKEKLAEHDVCIWALGTSSVGMSEEKYITVGYF